MTKKLVRKDGTVYEVEVQQLPACSVHNPVTFNSFTAQPWSDGWLHPEGKRPAQLISGG